jgi:membrane-bound metal-dependent hydrolase YbcI (DUF457 family)
MLPHGHFAAGYLVYMACSRGSQEPDRTDLFVLLLATQLPDLIDKPLSWSFGGAFVGGRTVGHSLLLAVPVVIIVWVLLARRRAQRRTALAFTLGYLTHPPGDAVPLLVQGSLMGDLTEVSFLCWPIEIPAAEIMAALANIPLLSAVIREKAAWAATTLPSGPALQMIIRGVEVCLLALAVTVWLRAGAHGAPWRDR